MISLNGWTYCLPSDCNQYIKIGRTSKPDINERLSAQGRSINDLAWAIPDSTLEGHFHNTLGDYRCFYVEAIARCQPKKLDRDWTDYKTHQEAVSAGWYNQEFKPVCLGKVEVFHISSSDARAILKKAYPEAFRLIFTQ